jgi:hypothetical protein
LKKINKLNLLPEKSQPTMAGAASIFSFLTLKNCHWPCHLGQGKSRITSSLSYGEKIKIDKRIFRLNGNFPEDFLHTVDRNMNTA